MLSYHIWIQYFGEKTFSLNLIDHISNKLYLILGHFGQFLGPVAPREGWQCCGNYAVMHWILRFSLYWGKYCRILSKIPFFAVICTSFNCGTAASAKIFANFPMFCQVTAEDCVDLRSITTLLSMMSQYFSDCDESMR